MTFAQEMAQVVHDLAAGNGSDEALGREVTITALAVDNTDFDPTDGSVSAVEEPDSDTVFGFDTRYSAYELKGTEILAQDVKLIVEIPSLVPEIGFTVTMSDVDYAVMNVSPINVQGVTVAYALQLRV